MSADRELAAIRARYERRSGVPLDRYSQFNPEVLARVQERQRVMLHLLSDVGVRSLDTLDVLEVGCGSGSNLLEFLVLGAAPERLAGNELLENRAAVARARLPGGVRLHVGDAASLPFGEGSFDIVYQSTVFSSILDPQLQQSVAASMWRCLRPGGGVLWYDFIFDNPSNPDVAGVPLRRVRELFPGRTIVTRRVTLAPPIARRVVAIHPVLYRLFNLLPPLRTHVLCWIEKP